ncbi:MAG TPA: hypothetical protein VFK32_02750 [Tepidiformaceae bacterium]|nr:hypothetical protein [Tepidiformaceae bacterium]
MIESGLTWKPLPPGAILYDEFRPGTQELAEHIFGAFRISESGGNWELTEYERRSGAGYRAQATKRFATREAAVAYAEEVMAATRG